MKESHRKRQGRFFENNGQLFLTAFLVGVSIMALETTAIRMLAPFFGTSQLIWTNIIATVLIALSAGYMIGGSLADKRPESKLLSRLIFAAGIWYVLVPWVAASVAQFFLDAVQDFNGGMITMILGSFLAAVFLFAPPLVLLGMVSPFLLRLGEVPGEEIGRFSGRIFAVSTLGSILGTFLPTLVTIPLWGVRSTMSVFAMLLFFVALPDLLKGRKMLLSLALPVVLILPWLSTPEPGIYESMYQHIEIRGVENGVRYMLFNEGRGVQSAYYPDSIFTGMYQDAYTLMAQDARQVLLLGSAGGTVARSIHEAYDGRVQVTGVEIDPLVTEIAREQFHLSEEIPVITQDARQYVKQTFLRYDLVIVDAYQQEMYIPWTMSTTEFWQEVAGILTEGGVVGLNVNASADNDTLLKTMQNTIACVFPYVMVVEPENEGSFNYQVLASFEPIVIPETSIEELEWAQEHLLADGRLVSCQEGEAVFTDDWAPVEAYTNAIFLKGERN